MKKRILIIDDEFGLADIVAQVLDDVGYDASVAINGRLGLDRLQEQGADLVLLDIMMPIMDGRAMLREMRNDARFKSVPVVLMTAVPEALPREEPSLHQAALVKPFSLEELFAVIRRFLEPAK